MTTAKIKAGDKESNIVTLGHYKISSIILPKSAQDISVTLEASYDGDDFSEVEIYGDGTVSFHLATFKRFVCFNPEAFEGIMYYRFVVDKPSEQELVFQIWHQDD